MVVNLLCLCILLGLYVVIILLSKVHVSPSRTSVINSQLYKFLTQSELPGFVGTLIAALILSLGFLNILGSIPAVVNPNMYYYFTAGLSVTLWLCIIVLVVKTQLPRFVSHLLPYGTPAGLALILPVIELFRLIIRPFTLMVRLRTNLSSGHIMIFIFSYFAVAAKSFPSLALGIGGLMFLLYCLEVFVCLLQAYIFASLLTLYYKETI